METQEIKCPVTRNNLKSVLFCTIAGFIFVFGFNYLVHVLWLSGIYAQTPQLWRTAEDMGQHFFYMQIMNLVIVFAAAELYGRFAKTISLGEGIRFGIVLGLLLGALDSISYAWLPISGELARNWFIAGFAEGLGLGVVYSFVYR